MEWQTWLTKSWSFQRSRAWKVRRDASLQSQKSLSQLISWAASKLGDRRLRWKWVRAQRRSDRWTSLRMNRFTFGTKDSSSCLCCIDPCSLLSGTGTLTHHPVCLKSCCSRMICSGGLACLRRSCLHTGRTDHPLIASSFWTVLEWLLGQLSHSKLSCLQAYAHSTQTPLWLATWLHCLASFRRFDQA